jgi:methyl-accepting chemotaxis protein
MVGRIQQCASSISTAASEIAAGNGALSERSERQAATCRKPRLRWRS